jgi:drug/metabolite transporter (DMT)-like permease
MIMTAGILLLLPGVIKSLMAHGFRKLLPLFLIGALVSIHWVSFYGSIKYSNASVAVICIGTTSLFTALLEPLLLKTRFRYIDLLLGVGMIGAVYLISNATPSGYLFGIMLGIISSFVAALFSILNKRYASHYPATLFTFAEMTGGWFFLCLILPLYIYFVPEKFVWPDLTNWTYLGLLSFFCTVVPFSLSVIALRKISAFTSVFLLNLEPLYALILAALILNEAEQLTPAFYLGALLMILLVMIHAFFSRQKSS